MFTKISVLVPTRGRLTRLRTLITSFDATTGNGPEAELVFRVDDDDTDTLNFLRAWGGHQVVLGPRMRGYASLPNFFNELVGFATGDVLMCGNDDMVFRTPGWAPRILAAANRYPDGLFDIGVSTHNEKHYPFSVTSKKVAEHLGFLWDPRIFWGDIFLRDVMQRFERCVPVSEVQIDHDWAGHTPDTVFVEGNSQRFQMRDASYWVEVHGAAVNDAVERLQVLRA